MKTVSSLLPRLVKVYSICLRCRDNSRAKANYGDYSNRRLCDSCQARMNQYSISPQLSPSLAGCELANFDSLRSTSVDRPVLPFSFCLITEGKGFFYFNCYLKTNVFGTWGQAFGLKSSATLSNSILKSVICFTNVSTYCSSK